MFTSISGWLRVALTICVAGTLLLGSPANASASHFNTNPYSTGCASNSYALSSKAVSGGTARIMVSRTCGTNWIDYQGKAQTTTKAGKDYKTGTWTRTEVDNVTHAVSMQSYAPGTTKYIAYIKIGSTTTTATCTTGCTWTTSSAPTSTLSAKVDSFVAKWKGKTADYDGYYGGQCVDLFNYYDRDVVRTSRRPSVAYAYQIWDRYDATKYTRVSASSTPRKGDVAIWASNYPYSGGAGHVAIVLSASGSSFTALTQNPGATKVSTFSRQYLRGFLRPKA